MIWRSAIIVGFDPGVTSQVSEVSSDASALELLVRSADGRQVCLSVPTSTVAAIPAQTTP